MRALLKQLFSLRGTYLFGLLTCSALLCAAAYFQVAMLLEPCPICIAQRMLLVLLALLFLIGSLYRLASVTFARVLNSIIFFVSLAGVALAARHAYLQKLPYDQQPACGPSLSYMLDHLPTLDVLRFMLVGDGDCAEIQWQWLGWSIPEWTMLFFALMALISSVNFFRRLT